MDIFTRARQILGESVDKEEQLKVAKDMIELVKNDKRGFAKIQPGVFLQTKESIIADSKQWDDSDPYKKNDYTTSKYWITTDNGVEPIGIDTPEELVNEIDIDVMDEAYKLNVGRLAKLKEETKEDVAIDEKKEEMTEAKEDSYVITYVDYTKYEYDYNEGQGKQVGEWDEPSLKGKSFSTLLELSKILSVACTKENTTALENGRIAIGLNVDKDDIQASDKQLEAFKQGKEKLYMLDINVYVSVYKEPTTDEMAKKLEISKA